MHDLLITNCRVVDGTGSNPFKADIAVKDGCFSKIAPRIDEPSARVFDAHGAFATPGFIDIHRHSDAFVFRPDYGTVQLRQGVTTTLNGNCGLSVAPCPPKWRKDILQYLKPIIGTLPDGVEFDTFSQYLDCVAARSLPINFGMHVGNGTLRMAVKGFAGGEPSNAEYAFIHTYLKDALAAGAFAVSLGLAYSPENNYNVDSLVKALTPLRGSGIPLTTHMRGEGSLLLSALREVIDTARRLEVPLHISHYKCVGQIHWGHVLRQATAMIEQERSRGMPITVDVYPWTAGSSQLAQVLPPEYLEGGLAKTTQRLRDPAQRKRCRELLLEDQTEFENQVKLLGWENIMVGSVKTEKNADCQGKRISEIAVLRGGDPYEVALELLADEECEVSMINFIACGDDIASIMRLPYSCIVSDSIYPDSGLPHPRQYGTFPKFLSEYVRDNAILSFPEAIHKITGGPATLMKIANKGFVKEGYDADVTVFDLEKVANHATYLDPKRFGTGFSLVLVNGAIAAENDECSGEKHGKVLRRGK